MSSESGIVADGYDRARAALEANHRETVERLQLALTRAEDPDERKRLLESLAEVESSLPARRRALLNVLF